MTANEHNPYQSPKVEECRDNVPSTPAWDGVGNRRTSRFIAAQLDHGFAVLLFFVAAMSLSSEEAFQVLPGVAALASYLGYYFFSEWLLGATPGKLFCKLRVRQISGKRCTARQIAIRTLTRLIEVNPILLGALPAGVAILCTERRQRIGDLMAGTVVIGD